MMGGLDPLFRNFFLKKCFIMGTFPQLRECVQFTLFPLWLGPTETFGNLKAFAVYQLFAYSTTTQIVVKSNNSQMMS